jgi:N-dimethylarginine dimethylaminohydrolase
MTQNTAPAAEATSAPTRTAHHRRYLMCRPEHFTVSYTINPWMEPANPTDTAKAVAQWQTLYDTYLALGHDVQLIDPIDVSNAVLYLVSDESRYVTGLQFKVDAGVTIR